MRVNQSTQLLSLCFLTLFAFACKKRSPVTIEKIGNNQEVPLNAKVPEPLQIKVLNHKGEPIKKLPVRFYVKNGSGVFEGNLYEKFDTTDENGLAECTFYFGVENITQQVGAEVKNYDGPEIVFNTNPQYITDSRDGETYLLTQIGAQIWTAQNIRHNAGSAAANPNFPSTVYGRLYNWYDAQTVCPSGFRLPTTNEYVTMTTIVGTSFSTIGKKLKSRSGWYHVAEGKNLVGFNLYPAGNFIQAMSDFRGLGEYAALWTADEQDALNGRYVILSYNSDNLLQAAYQKSTLSSCRCIKE